MRKLVDEDSRREKEEVERQAKTGFAGAHVLRGDLGILPFPELLAQLYRGRRTGALLLRRDKLKKVVHVRDGRALAVKSNLLSECLGRVMVRERMISEADCEKSLLRMKETGQQQGTVLVEMGCVTPRELVVALRHQREDKLFEVFHWKKGEFQFDPRAPVPTDANQFHLPPARLIMEGIRRAWDAARLEVRLGDLVNLHVHMHPQPLQNPQELALSRAEQNFLNMADGRRTLARMLAESELPPDKTLTLTYALLAAEIVETRSHREPHPPAGSDDGPTSVDLRAPRPPASVDVTDEQTTVDARGHVGSPSALAAPVDVTDEQTTVDARAPVRGRRAPPTNLIAVADERTSVDMRGRLGARPPPGPGRKPTRP